MDARQLRAEELLATGMIHRQGHVWFVPSQSGGARHTVIFNGNAASCDCEDFDLRQLPCKHILAVRMLLARELLDMPMPQRPETPPIPKRKTYAQDWPNYNLAQTNEKIHFQDLLAELCRTIPEPAARPGPGRKPIPLADSLFAAAFKVYSTISARRFMCDLEDAYGRGHIGRLPHFNSVLAGLENPAATPILCDLIRQSALPLSVVEVDFAPDSSGFMTSRFVRWYDQKYGTTKQEHEWVKVHLMCGVKTNIVTAVEIHDKYTHDSPLMPALVETTATGFRIRDVSADKGYTAAENFDAVAKHGGTLYAAFKSGTTGGIGGLFEKMFHLFSLNREEYLQHYHKRSNVESTFSMIKRKFGDALRSKTDDAMKNEALAKILCHNLCCLISAWYELGIEPMFGAPPEDDEPRDVLRFVRPAQ
jgi:transposase